MNKKSISIAILMFFVFGTFGVVNAQQNENMNGYEKISRPSEIKNFTKIMKKGNSLYGIPKAEKNSTEIANSLEKILSPGDIRYFKNIRKIGTALWGVRKENPIFAYRVVTAEMAPCVKSAIEIKDAAVMANNLDLTTKLNVAIASRTTCQVTAIMSTENQQEAVKTCVKAFQETRLNLVKAHKQKNDETWKIFNTSLKACTATTTPVVAEVPVAPIVVEDGGSSVIEIVE